MKHGSRKGKQQRPSKKESAKNYDRQGKKEKTNTCTVKNDGRPLRQTESEENLIYKELLKQSGNKVRVNDLNTGRLIWIKESNLENYQVKKAKQQQQKKNKAKKELSKYLDIPLGRIESLDLYDNVSSSKQIKDIIKREGRLRYNGKFISKDAQAQIVKFSEVLDREGVEYNLNDLLKFPEIEKKILVIKDRTPKHLFYWNLQNRVHENKFGNPHVIIKDYDGKIIFDGKAGRRNVDGIYKFKNEMTTQAVKGINELNRKLENLETLINEKDDIEPYFTIPVYETTREGEVLKIIIDYSGVEARIPSDLFTKYKQLL
jgi:hypothetical protein